MVEGQLMVKDQVREYVDRRDALENWSYLDYFLGMYDGKTLKDRTGPRGCKANTRVPYRENRNRNGHCRVIRPDGHETMPYFPGKWFPKKDNDDVNGIFEALMLALLKPWRSVSDVKKETETFQDAFDDFITHASAEVLRIVDNIQFFHECSESAKTQSEEGDGGGHTTFSDTESEHDIDELECFDHTPVELEDPSRFDTLISEEDIQRAVDKPFSALDLLYADKAMNIGKQSGALTGETYCVAYHQPATQATMEHVYQFHIWKDSLQGVAIPTTELEVDAHSPSCEQSLMPLQFDERSLSKLTMTYQNEPNINTYSNNALHCTPRDTALNKRQTMVYNIITNHLKTFLRDENPPQRLMIVHGQGGTGKSALLNAISSTFDDLHASSLLAKTATSGVAASIIGGQTLHMWGALPLRNPSCEKWLTHPSKEVDA